ncbi:MFS transporter, DHA2 family, multidrug resistance protein [Micromonospora echinaurantiaca]|uniref:MFS transporter, DHA2 family, multidrug resistance protein n=1 Tax=Micromonospora echinaurantiaca TaxID=47857 RepID=A0A1C5II01_9ACTN|nr:MFS transporter [Micromonospora echinaurantiaca]SCG57386.1 MFS transporter, DHA2 family, multidrug resistance protein [Micromonospora echinaurantiaca]
MTTKGAAPATGGRVAAGRREWLGLVVLGLPTLLISMDMTVLHLAVPQISAALNPSGAQLLWIVDVYSFFVAGLLIVMGAIGDRIGRRRLLLAGAVGFGVASLLAAYSTSAETLIVARALLGVAGSTLMPSTLALIRNMFHDAKQRAMAVAAWSMTLMAGAALGPVVGGVLLEFFWWGSVFLLAVPVMAILLAFAPVLLPEHRDHHPPRLDWAGAVLSLIAVLAAIYGLKRAAEDGLDGVTALAMGVGLTAGLLFIAGLRRSNHPLIDLTLFRRRTFSVALSVLLLSTLVLFGITYFTAQYVQLVLGLSPLAAGLWMVPPLLVGLLLTMLATAASGRLRPTHVIVGGLALAAPGFAVLAGLDDTGDLPQLVIGLAFAFGGILPASTLGVDIVISAAPPQRAGAASAISETATELGGALGIAVLGSIGAAVYRERIGAALPAGTSQRVADAARDSLGGATAAELPPAVLSAAREAFAAGMRVSAIVAALLVVAASLTVATVLRQTRGSRAAGRGQRAVG